MHSPRSLSAALTLLVAALVACALSVPASSLAAASCASDAQLAADASSSLSRDLRVVFRGLAADRAKTPGWIAMSDSVAVDAACMPSDADAYYAGDHDLIVMSHELVDVVSPLADLLESSGAVSGRTVDERKVARALGKFGIDRRELVRTLALLGHESWHHVQDINGMMATGLDASCNPVDAITYVWLVEVPAIRMQESLQVALGAAPSVLLTINADGSSVRIDRATANVLAYWPIYILVADAACDGEGIDPTGKRHPGKRHPGMLL